MLGKSGSLATITMISSALDILGTLATLYLSYGKTYILINIVSKSVTMGNTGPTYVVRTGMSSAIIKSLQTKSSLTLYLASTVNISATEKVFLII